MKRLSARLGAFAACVATRLFHSGMFGIVSARLLLAGVCVRANECQASRSCAE
jgi:hypothetical protein